MVRLGAGRVYGWLVWGCVVSPVGAAGSWGSVVLLPCRGPGAARGGRRACDGCSMDVAFGGGDRRCGCVSGCVCWWGVGGGDAGLGVRADDGRSGGRVRRGGFCPVVRGGDGGGARADLCPLRGGR